MKIKMLFPITDALTGAAYKESEEVEMQDTMAEKLVAAGHAVKVAEKAAEKPKRAAKAKAE